MLKRSAIVLAAVAALVAAFVPVKKAETVAVCAKKYTCSLDCDEWCDPPGDPECTWSHYRCDPFMNGGACEGSGASYWAWDGSCADRYDYNPLEYSCVITSGEECTMFPDGLFIPIEDPTPCS